MSETKNKVIASLKKNIEVIAAKKKALVETETRLNRIHEERAKGFQIDAKTVHELITRQEKLRREVSEAVKAAKDEATEIYDSAIEECRAADIPKGADLSSDAALLKSGVRLSSDELLHLMAKPENMNATMNRMFMDAAKDYGYLEPSNPRLRNAFVSAAYAGHNEEIKELKDEKNALDYVARWLDRPDAEKMVDKMLGDGIVTTM